MIDSYCAGDSIKPYTITEAVDADGDGKKELLVELYLSGTKRGQDILMTLSDIRTQEPLFTAQPTGGYIETTDDIPLWSVEGLLSMCAGDFDGDGCQELAVYTPNNKQEIGSISNNLAINIYKLGAAPTELPKPQETIYSELSGSVMYSWSYSTVDGKKQYYSLPFMALTAGDMDKDGIDDLFSVANFSTSFRGAAKDATMTWRQLINPDACFGSVLDVYKGQSGDSLKQVVTQESLLQSLRKSRKRLSL